MNTTAKERILETAADLFFRQGYARTGINQIITESNIAKGSLYYNFKSKTDVLVHYLKMSEAAIFERFEKELSKEQNPKNKLLKLVDVRFSLLRDGLYKGCRFIRIVSEISREEEEAVLPLVRDFKDRFRSLVQELASQLDDKNGGNSALADTIYLLMEGAAAQAPIFKNDSSFVRARAIIASML